MKRRFKVLVSAELIEQILKNPETFANGVSRIVSDSEHKLPGDSKLVQVKQRAVSGCVVPNGDDRVVLELVFESATYQGEDMAEMLLNYQMIPISPQTFLGLLNQNHPLNTGKVTEPATE